MKVRRRDSKRFEDKLEVRSLGHQGFWQPKKKTPGLSERKAIDYRINQKTKHAENERKKSNPLIKKTLVNLHMIGTRERGTWLLSRESWLRDLSYHARISPKVKHFFSIDHAEDNCLN
jgi:hypothetical protein